jgi:uncharacterized membrane protein
MGLPLAAHVIGGALGIGCGFVALYAAKGARLHRKSGMLFVYAMLVMALFGATLAMVMNKAATSNTPVGLLTAYLVITGLMTVRPPSARSRQLDLGLMLVALAVGLALFTFGAAAVASPNGRLQGMPALPFFLFGSIALMSSIGDLRMIRAGGIQGAPRLTRHLWRMCLALFIAAASFFLGPTRRIPEVMRIPALLPVPVVAVLVTTLYWLWRVRIRRSFQASGPAIADRVVLSPGATGPFQPQRRTAAPYSLGK